MMPQRIMVRVIGVAALAVLSAGMGRKNTHLMGVVGDSISAAAVANLPLRGPLPYDPGLGNETRSVIARMFLEHKSTLSWASGRRVDSHYERLNALSPVNVAVANVAVSGSRAQDLPAQIDELVKRHRKGKYLELSYVTILIGANDACSHQAQEDPDFRRVEESLMQTFTKLSRVSQQAPIRVLLSGPPMVPELGRLDIRRSRTIFGLTCQRFRDEWLESCARLVQWKDHSEYQAAADIIHGVHQALERAARRAQQLFPSLEILYTRALAEMRIEASVLAADCFHPSAEGQNAIAQLFWNELPAHWRSIGAEPVGTPAALRTGSAPH
jgi:lysophospholipase L1-like esterase